MPEIKYPFQCNLLVVQPTPFCNLACSYCYLNDKDNKGRLSTETLERVLTEVFSSGLITRETTLVWHAGEPLTLPIKHFESLLESVKKIDKEKRIRHSVQTNATTLNDAWCELLKEYKVDIGVSIDGPKMVNDSMRLDRKGRGSYDATIRGLNLLKKWDISHHIISVVSRESLNDPLGTIDFFKSLGVRRVGFNIEEVEGSNVSSTADVEESLIRDFFEYAHEVHIDPNVPITIREFDRTYKLIAMSPDQRGRTEFVNMNEQVRPFGILNVDYLGRYSTFSPELLGQNEPKFNNFVFGQALPDYTGLERSIENKHLMAVFNSIQNGVKKCAEECGYFSFCGGGSPSNKFYENQDFDSSTTFHCKSSVQTPFDIVMKSLEAGRQASAK